MNRAILITLPTVVVLAAPGLARAALVTWEFAGEITFVYDQADRLGGRVAAGSPFSGFFTFETTASDSWDDPNVGNYQAVTEFGLQMAELPFARCFEGAIFVANGYEAYPSDRFGLNFSGEFLGEPAYGYVSFVDESGTAFGSDALPVTILDLSAFDQTMFNLRPLQDIPFWNVQGDITSLVPEPATLILFVSGGVLITRRCPRSR